jgi:hypothetical protein
MGQHKGHVVEPITEAVDTIKKKLWAAVEDVDEKAKLILATVAEVQSSGESAVEQKCDEAVVAIKQHFSGLHELLTTRQEHLLQQVQSVREAKVSNLRAHLDTLKAVNAQMDDSTKTCRRMLEESHFSDLLRSKDSIMNRLHSLSTVRWSAKAPAECDLRVSFDATDSSVRRLLADVGSVTCKEAATGPSVEIPQPNATQQFQGARDVSVAREGSRVGGTFLNIGGLGQGFAGGRGKVPREEAVPAGQVKRTKKAVIPPPPASVDTSNNEPPESAGDKKWVLRI